MSASTHVYLIAILEVTVAFHLLQAVSGLVVLAAGQQERLSPGARLGVGCGRTAVAVQMSKWRRTRKNAFGSICDQDFVVTAKPCQVEALAMRLRQCSLPKYVGQLLWYLLANVDSAG